MGIFGNTCSQRGPENCEFCHIHVTTGYVLAAVLLVSKVIVMNRLLVVCSIVIFLLKHILFYIKFLTKISSHVS